MRDDWNVFEFIITKVFTPLVQELLCDDEYHTLQRHLIESPDAGGVIPGSGGVRKIRWRTSGHGKRGGLRVIYFSRRHPDEIWLLTLYPKNVRDNIPAQVLKKIRDEVE